jgi:hypothetical protein
MATDLVSDETEAVDRAGVAGLRREDLTIERLGFSQPSRPVMLNRQIESLRNGHGGMMENENEGQTKRFDALAASENARSMARVAI